MLRFLLRRFIVALLVAATVLTLVFMLTRLSGDLAISIAGANATQADVELIRKAYGLDRPVYIQFFDWVGRAMIGDFGESFFFKARTSQLIGERMPVTITLGLVGLLIALVVSIPMGIAAAVNEGTWVDKIVQFVALLGQAMPGFWLGLLLMITFGLQLGWLQFLHQRHGACAVLAVVGKFHTLLLAPEQVGSKDRESVLCVLLGHALDVRVDAENLLEQHDAGSAAGRRQRQIGVTGLAVAGCNGDPFGFYFFAHVCRLRVKNLRPRRPLRRTAAACRRACPAR